MPKHRTDKRLLRPLIRASFYPTLLLNRLVCAVGIWHRWDWIDDHVAVGGLPSRRDLKRLAESGVRGIVNLCEEHRGHAATLAALQLTELHLPTLDYHRPSADDIARGVNFVTQQIASGHKVYIHCKAGRGRSVATVMGYLIDTRKISAVEAHRLIKAVRPQIDNDIPRNAEVLAFEQRVLGRT